MNGRGQAITVGFALLMVFFVIALVLFAMIEPFKEQLDTNRQTSSLNCPGTVGFNQTDYDDDNSLEKLTRRPTCFITGVSMVWFIGAVMVAGLVWVVRNWTRLRR